MSINKYVIFGKYLERFSNVEQISQDIFEYNIVLNEMLNTDVHDENFNSLVEYLDSIKEELYSFIINSYINKEEMTSFSK